MAVSAHPRARYYRSVWLSDLHLGLPGCRAEDALAFLKAVECDRLYLVGDILDLWYMQKGFSWPQSHNDVLRAVLGKARRGTRVVYVPGNHDEMLRAHTGTAFGNIRVVNRLVHTTADGRRLLVLHGDQFDSVVQFSRVMSIFGTRAYGALSRVNQGVSCLRRALRLPPWSLASFLKHRVRDASPYRRRFEEAAVDAARARGVDGVVCGHSHRPALREGEVTYCNTGDWLDHCTALVEEPDGRLALIGDSRNELITHSFPKAAA
jgi:UDP-2,3-diacylglucosamine pyrophosphatase LpxH